MKWRALSCCCVYAAALAPPTLHGAPPPPSPLSPFPLTLPTPPTPAGFQLIAQLAK
jgi:hypothetical protein